MLLVDCSGAIMSLQVVLLLLSGVPGLGFGTGKSRVHNFLRFKTLQDRV